MAGLLHRYTSLILCFLCFLLLIHLRFEVERFTRLATFWVMKKAPAPFAPRFANRSPCANPTTTMIARTSLTVAALLALASCSPFKKDKDHYDTRPTHDGNPYGVPGYDTSGTETGTYTPEGSTAANPTYAPAAYEETTPKATGKTTTAAAKTAATTKPATTKSAAAGNHRATTVHTVVAHDTLWGIAKKYGVTENAIKAANHMTKNTVVLGAKLTIPAR